MLTRCPYEILMLPFGARFSEVRAKRNEILQSLHPDKVQNNEFTLETIKQVNLAYDFLNDAERKRKYDNREIGFDGRPRRRASAPPPPPPPPSPPSPPQRRAPRQPMSEPKPSGRLGTILAWVAGVSVVCLIVFSGAIADLFEKRAETSQVSHAFDCLKQHAQLELNDELFELEKPRRTTAHRVIVFGQSVLDDLNTHAITLTPMRLSYDRGTMRAWFRASSQSDQSLLGVSGAFYILDSKSGTCESVEKKTASSGVFTEIDRRYVAELVAGYSVEDIGIGAGGINLPSRLEGTERTYFFVLEDAYTVPPEGERLAD